ncbi:DUF624 domain-containing protein [Alloscardovia theropitheci]|uniref:DUF624 domain-containing protein n=1 Tax=Alloscardovia theropitheci TaxID=2496842 RepID=A0A4R0QTL7_9BIFI|nr:YesL family protein [Alloscardovia theropitheci]TCD54635.1 DUF624 domain-containing protein [Alloscardovia theropitheci]
MNWLSPDSRFMQAWGNFTDGIIINILMILTSIPVITIGASLTAGNVTARKTLYGEGRGVLRNYFTALRENLRQSIVLWLPYMIVGIALGYMWFFVHIRELLIIQYGLSIVWVIGCEWTFATQARFENSIGRTLFNGLVFGVTHWTTTIVLVIIDAIFVGIIIATFMYMPRFLFLVIVIGYGSMLMLHVPLTERVFKKYYA